MFAYIILALKIGIRQSQQEEGMKGQMRVHLNIQVKAAAAAAALVAAAVAAAVAVVATVVEVEAFSAIAIQLISFLTSTAPSTALPEITRQRNLTLNDMAVEKFKVGIGRCRDKD